MSAPSLPSHAVPDEQDGLPRGSRRGLYESPKREPEAAAAREGMSLNAWLVRALSCSVRRYAAQQRQSTDRLRPELEGIGMTFFQLPFGHVEAEDSTRARRGAVESAYS